MEYQPSIRKLASIGGVLLSLFVALLPMFLRWMLLGAVLALAGVYLYIWLTTGGSETENTPYMVQDLASLPPLHTPQPARPEDDTGVFSCWFNEIETYDPDTYSSNLTTSVFIELNGSELCLQTPKHNIPRQAMWDEEIYTRSSLIKHRMFDLTGATVKLIPSDLTIRRLWSRRYPIYLSIPIKGHRSSINASPDMNQRSITKVKLYLFARCARDKEDWYRRLVAAASGKPLPTNVLSALARTASSHSLNSDQSESSVGSTATEESSPTKRLAGYLDYMAQVMPAEVQRHWIKHRYPDARLHRCSQEPLLHTPVMCEPQLAWLNAIITRCFWDCHKDDYWGDVIQDILQRKLDKIQVPYFMEALVITSVDPGTEMPIIQRASMPYIDDRGLWTDLDITYAGGFSMNIETKLNIHKLTSKREQKLKPSPSQNSMRDWSDSDSDEEPQEEESGSSSESRDETDSKSKQSSPKSKRRSKKSRVLRMMEKIAHSKYVHKATENKTIKKYIDKVSNTPLVLSVTVNHISGCVALNIPHPPSDRIWYGFRGNPCLRLTAKPSIGEKKFGLTRAINWIEKKLVTEFQKFMVMPNMQNIAIGMMSDHPSPLDDHITDATSISSNVTDTTSMSSNVTDTISTSSNTS